MIPCDIDRVRKALSAIYLILVPVEIEATIFCRITYPIVRRRDKFVPFADEYNATATQNLNLFPSDSRLGWNQREVQRYLKS